MRYPKGSVHLENFKDKVILNFLAESHHATRSQLVQFVRCYYCEFNWPSSIGGCVAWSMLAWCANRPFPC
jgi:hypothetical protein